MAKAIEEVIRVFERFESIADKLDRLRSLNGESK